MGFYGSPLNPTSLTSGLITVEATPGKEPGKEGTFAIAHCCTSYTIFEVSRQINCSQLCILSHFFVYSKKPYDTVTWFQWRHCTPCIHD